MYGHIFAVVLKDETIKPLRVENNNVLDIDQYIIIMKDDSFPLILFLR